MLLATARLTAGDPSTAVGLLAPLATAATTPSLLFSRQQTLARYASALLAEGQPVQALDWARRAVGAPAEDVRSVVLASRTLAETLAAVGEYAEAGTVAAEAVRLAYSTQQASERAGAEALCARLAPHLPAR